MASGWQHPNRLIALGFLAVIAIGTVLLMLPISRAGDAATPFLTALFTAVSATCVTGLAVVDTATHWSGFGQAVIMALFQIGGFGIMTGATLLTLMVSPSLGLKTRLLAQAETRQLGLGDIGGVVRLVFVVTLAVELAVAVLLGLRFHLGYGQAWPEAVWNGVFHAISAFNNAGFSTYSDGVMGYQRDGWVLGALMAAIIIGGIGFPVLHELRQPRLSHRRGWRHWSLHSRLTVGGTLALLALGFVGIGIAEWNNAGTLGPMSMGQKLLNAAFHSVSARTAGFNSVDVGAMREETLALHDLLMFIGGGSAGTAGGIKITTALLLGVIVVAQIRGSADANVFGRRIGADAQRQALSVVMLGMAMIFIATLLILASTDLPLSPVLFEVVSAFGTVGLSTGITADLPPLAQSVLIVLMFTGRVGTITLATALAMRSRQIRFRYPEERPIVG